ncbi:hypothetical protein ASPZODRAFT_99019 [Penicilliopsis zonata CBS 506.65]|uniref:Cytochrome P450 n=1 Tax=Penicilliopsis zonata CBS 506.65 TaxID=1073090 RepID=A0A1L9SFT4_9EURO|nr:hypothetical protein ASPZODRAFT_99019 [Penicilliopsis zonata CBS 506.65]OJJ45957.1 hypothetical protein ASPZODRAFT_99019 [Penicilliopsis zonata CBS 506.65]
MADSLNLCFEGYTKYSKNNAVWSTWTFDELIYVYPPSMVDEIKAYPPDQLNFSEIVEDQFLWHLYMGNTLTERKYVHAVQKHLISNLPDMTEYLAQTVQEALIQRLAPPEHSNGWRVVMLWDALIDVANMTVGHAMVGEEMVSHPDYLKHATGYIDTVTGHSVTMFLLPAVLREPYFWLSSWGRRARSHLHAVKRMVIPELGRLQREGKSGPSRAMVEKMLAKPVDEMTPKEADEIVNQMLILTFAAAGMWCMIQCQIVLTYLAHPEFAHELRQEITQQLAIHGGWTRQAVAAMPKLDSFLRETLRCSPPIIYTIQRKAMKELVLSDGSVLPPGQKLMIPTLSLLRDPAIYPDPDTFNPWRWYDAKENKTKLQAVTQTAEFPVFGFGNQTCPGRFFGLLLTKLTFAQLIIDYEVKFVPERKGKPVDWPIGAALMPNLDTFVAMRRLPGHR